MLILSLDLFFVLICLEIGEAFFLFENHQPILFCIKICPLYCSPRRHDKDASSFIYTDEDPNSYYDYPSSPHHDSYKTSTTTKPTSTTAKRIPYFHHDYYNYTSHKSTTPQPTTSTPGQITYFYHDYYDYKSHKSSAKPQPTTSTTERIPYFYHDLSNFKPYKSTTHKPTTSPLERIPYFYHDSYYYVPHKSTTPKPTTTTTEPIPYFYHEDYDYIPYLYHYSHKKRTTTTTTEMPTTTTEPTWICMVCLKKCGYPPKQ